MLAAQHVEKLVEERLKVRWALKVDLLERLLVCFDDSLYTVYRRVLQVGVDWEAVVYGIMPHALVYAAETKDRELFVVIVGLYD